MKQKFIIKSNDDFNNIIQNGNKLKGRILSLYYIKSEDNKNYFGFAIGKKLGNAVTRNYIKRRLRMMVSCNQLLFPKGYKYIIMVKKDHINDKYIMWEDDLKQIIGKVDNNEK